MSTKEKKITWTTDIANGTLTAAVIGSGKLVMNVRAMVGAAIYDSLPDIGKSLLCHGVKQKVGDAASALRGSDAYKAMKSMWTKLQTGTWSAERGATGARIDSLETVACAALWSVSPETAVDRLNKESEADKKERRKSVSYRIEYNRANIARLESRAASE